jgi:hypothetical protein
MDEILKIAAERWPEMSLLAVILIKLFSSQLAVFVPQVVKDYFNNKARLRADQQEHDQAIRKEQTKFELLEKMSDMSSSRFIEDQLTQMTAETQVQLITANDYIRTEVSQKLDMVLEKQNMILAELRV